MKPGLSRILSILCLSLLNAIFSNSATAQVTTDGTTSTTVNSNGNNVEINDGDRAGGNLFHSFRDFSVPNGGEVFFNNANDIVNIFSRVTGGNISNIDGLLRANGGANLFLINPAGILFGEGARLDIGGSFLGTSADSILFEDGEFSATDLDNPPLLTINAPIGLNFRDNPGDITNNSVANNGNGLEISRGNNIALIGGNVNFNGGSILAPGGRVELGGLTSAGTININNDGSLQFPDAIARGDVSLTNNASVTVMADGGGFINVNARTLRLSGQSELFAGIAENTTSPQAQAGDITINATESVIINGELSTADSTAPFNEFLEQLTTERDNATGIRNNVGLYAIRRNDGSPRSNALGNGGNIIINTGTLELSDVAVLDTSLLGEGTAGDININADLVLLNGGVLLTQVRGFQLENIQERAIGDAGDVNINTGSFILNDRSGILADVQAGATGNGGDLIVNASGEVALNEVNLLLTELGIGSVGNAGNIDITANSLTLTENSSLISIVQVDGEGNAGNITLDISKNISLDEGSQILTQVQQGAVGNGGDITIEAANFIANDSSPVQANSLGLGNAGNIRVTVEDTIELRDGSSFNTATTFGEGGNITLNIANSLFLSESSLISAQATDNADGGNINIDTNFIVAFPNQNNDIIANAQQGQGGNININAESIFGIQENPVLNPITNDLNASSARGAQFNGNVAITTPEVDAIRGVTELPTTVIEAQQTTEEACAANSDNGKPNGLTVKGKGGILPSPNAIFSADALNIGGKIVADNNERSPSVPLSKGEENAVSSQINAESTEIKPISTSHGDIYPARGIIKTADGRVILTAYPTDNVTRVPNRSVNCNNLTRSSTDQGIRSSRR
jgi:filamentous hemagglutinin family protein